MQVLEHLLHFLVLVQSHLLRDQLEVNQSLPCGVAVVGLSLRSRWVGAHNMYMCTRSCMYMCTRSQHVHVYKITTCTYVCTRSQHVRVYKITTCTYVQDHNMYIRMYKITTCTCVQDHVCTCIQDHDMYVHVYKITTCNMCTRSQHVRMHVCTRL